MSLNHFPLLHSKSQRGDLTLNCPQFWERSYLLPHFGLDRDGDGVSQSEADAFFGLT